MKQTVEDDKVKDKISDEERKQICEEDIRAHSLRASLHRQLSLQKFEKF